MATEVRDRISLDDATKILDRFAMKSVDALILYYSGKWQWI